MELLGYATLNTAVGWISCSPHTFLFVMHVISKSRVSCACVRACSRALSCHQSLQLFRDTTSTAPSPDRLSSTFHSLVLFNVYLTLQLALAFPFLLPCSPDCALRSLTPSPVHGNLRLQPQDLNNHSPEEANSHRTRSAAVRTRSRDMFTFRSLCCLSSSSSCRQRTFAESRRASQASHSSQFGKQQHAHSRSHGSQSSSRELLICFTGDNV